MLPLKSFARASRRAGLTLIELVVVLTILVALGSLLVPVIGNALTRSHVATCATNIPETNKLLIGALATNGSLGDGWSTGVFSAGAGDGEAVNNSVATANGGGGAGTLVAAVLTADESAAMTDTFGITNVFNHGDPVTVPEYDVTFNAGLTTEPLATAEVITLNDAQADSLSLPLPSVTGNKLIWLGIDKPCTLVGTLLPEPPVHFGDTEGAFPNQVYSRFGAVFEVEDGPGVGDGAARFVMVSYNLEGEDGFETADNHIGIHWDEVQGSGL